MSATVNNDNNIPERREVFRRKLQAYRNWFIKKFDDVFVTEVVEYFYLRNFLTSEHKNAIEAGPYAQEKMRTFLDILETVVLRYDNVEDVFLSFLKKDIRCYWLKTFETNATPPPEIESVEEESDEESAQKESAKGSTETDATQSERNASSQKESVKASAETGATQSERNASSQKESAKGPAETGATRSERKDSPHKGRAKGKGQGSVEPVMEEEAVVGAKTDTTPPEKTGSTTEGAKGSAETGATQSERKESTHEGAKGSAETVMEQQEEEHLLGATGGY